MKEPAADLIVVPDAPRIPGLAFRRYRGPVDYPLLVSVILACAEADSVERADTVEDVANAYEHLVNCDPRSDMIFAEMDGRLIGYGRCWWWHDPDGPFSYDHALFLVPGWRRKGIDRAMLRWMESRQRCIAAGQPSPAGRQFQAMAFGTETDGIALLESEGYKPARYFFEMVRPTMDGIPEFVLPHGLETRPARPEHYRAIWDAGVEAFQDHWRGMGNPTDTEYQAWLTNPTVFQPALWQVAWDVASNQVAGQVLTFIDHAQNARFNRRRGYTENIAVRRPWRRQGVARALIAASLRAQKAAGMTESALGVDSENLSGAVGIYEACGFRTVKKNATYRKPMDAV